MNFIETIKVVDGVAQNLDLHLKRSSQTMLYNFGIIKELPLAELLYFNVNLPLNGVYKLRVIYSKDIIDYSLEPYIPKDIKTLRMIDGGDIDYRFKYENRDAINTLLEKRGDCDDILIVKEGIITDSSYCNVVFGEDSSYFTPADPLLKGTKRESLLISGAIRERVIRDSEIERYRNVFIINAMLDMTPVSITLS
jgi:4-amino-4-deoxychorismate lyase